MSKFIDIEEIVSRQKKVVSWLDKLSFLHILMLWILIIFSFGLIYFYFRTSDSFLMYTLNNQPVTGIRDSLYFSFVAATTTGFGDVVPSGFFKFISVFEVVFDLLLLAIVTSKLVSLKQDVILNEIYELSMNEEVSRLRSALLLFRQNLDRIMNRIEINDIRKRDIDNIYVYISPFEDVINEILKLISKSYHNNLVKEISSVNIELMLNSILSSFDKLTELITCMNYNKLKWKREVTLQLIKGCVNTNNELFNKLKESNKLSQQSLSDLEARRLKIMSKIREVLICDFNYLNYGSHTKW